MVACAALVPADGAPAQSGRLVVDDFAQDRLASDYVVHAGGPMEVSGGALRAPTATPDKVITHNAAGGLIDAEVTLRVNLAANASSGTTAAIVKFLGPGDYLRLGTTYSTSSIKVTKWDGGVRTDLLAAGNLFTLSPDTSYWVRARTQGNDVTVELWAGDPQLGGAPLVAQSYTLTAGDAAKFGAGVAGAAGIYLDPSDDPGREFDDLRIAEIPAPPAPPGPSTGGACELRALGTAAGDVLTGTAAGDFISALAGDDSVRALRGDDCVFGEAGNDRLYGDGGGDSLQGGKGTDRLRGGPGDDRVAGHGGRDRAWGGPGADRIAGGPRADVLRGGAGSDRLSGGGGADRIYGGEAVFAGAGRDRIDVAGGGRDRVSCGSGRDVVRADRRDRVRSDCERVIRVG